MADKKLTVYLQILSGQLHPVSRKILTTAIALGADGDYRVEGLAFVPELTEETEKMLCALGMNQVTVFEDPLFDAFYPEGQASCIAENDPGEILLFPATPEGRSLSSMTAAMLHTGVTADCTALSFTGEGLLLQTRPAFSGNRMASIVTRECRPQIASLRFGTPVENRQNQTKLLKKTPPGRMLPYEAVWLDRSEQTMKSPRDVILAVGGGIGQKEDLAVFRRLAEQLGAEFCCSRALVDRGWMSRKQQIGLSGQSVSAKLLLCFGISGSVQFRAGLDEIEHLIAVDENPETPLMKLADTPIQGDLYAVAEAMCRKNP